MSTFTATRPLISILIFIASLSVSHRQLQAQVYRVSVEKQEEKKKTRWTLSEWMETKKKMSLMDSWLAAHSSPFETVIEGAYGWGANGLGSMNEHSLYQFALASYASIAGLRGEYESSLRTRFSAAFHLRLMGYYEQGSNLTFETGARLFDGASTHHYFVGVKSSFYLSPFLGIEGVIRHFFKSEDDLQWHAGLFIDYGMLQVFGRYQREHNKLSNSRHVSLLGLRMNF